MQLIRRFTGEQEAGLFFLEQHGKPVKLRSVLHKLLQGRQASLRRLLLTREPFHICLGAFERVKLSPARGKAGPGRLVFPLFQLKGGFGGAEPFLRRVRSGRDILKLRVGRKLRLELCRLRLKLFKLVLFRPECLVSLARGVQGVLRPVEPFPADEIFAEHFPLRLGSVSLRAQALDILARGGKLLPLCAQPRRALTSLRNGGVGPAQLPGIGIELRRELLYISVQLRKLFVLAGPALQKRQLSGVFRRARPLVPLRLQRGRRALKPALFLLKLRELCRKSLTKSFILLVLTQAGVYISEPLLEGVYLAAHFIR